MDDAGIAPQSRKAVPEQYVAGSVEHDTALLLQDAGRVVRGVEPESRVIAGHLRYSG
jgi:hypothetical protein